MTQRYNIAYSHIMLLKIAALSLLLAQTSLAEPPNPVDAARREIQRLIQVLPAWETDSLAQYEQPELEAVRGDIRECLTDSTDDELLHDFDNLKRAADALQATDDRLNKTDVI